MRHRPRPILVLSLLLVTAAAHADPPPPSKEARRQAMKHYEAGEAALASEHFQEAVEELRQATSLDPLLVIAHYDLGRAHMAQKEFPEAVRAYRDCRGAYEEDLRNQVDKATGWEQRLDDQIRALEDQIAILSGGAGTGPRPGLSGPAPLSAANVGRVQQQLDTLKIQRKRGATGVGKTPAWISVALGSAYFRNNALADAEREYKAAIDSDGKAGEAHNNLAVVYLLTKRAEEARREVDLAERAGFKVPDGLKRDLARLPASTPTP